MKIAPGLLIFGLFFPFHEQAADDVFQFDGLGDGAPKHQLLSSVSSGLRAFNLLASLGPARPVRSNLLPSKRVLRMTSGRWQVCQVSKRKIIVAVVLERHTRERRR